MLGGMIFTQPFSDNFLTTFLNHDNHLYFLTPLK